jgi:hypothetical protein
MSVRAFLNRHTTSDCCWEQTWIDLWWWRWWTSDDVTIFYLITVRLHVSMCNRRMHYLIRRVSNKLLPLFSLDGSPWSTDQGRTRHLYRYVFVASHAIVSYYFSRSLSLSLSLYIDCSDTIEHEKFYVCYCIVYRYNKSMQEKRMFYTIQSLIIKPFIDWLQWYI